MPEKERHAGCACPERGTERCLAAGTVGQCGFRYGDNINGRYILKDMIIGLLLTICPNRRLSLVPNWTDVPTRTGSASRSGRWVWIETQK